MSACTPDFNGSDFEQEDFQTHLTIMDFGNYLFDRFPEYFHREDTYKDSNNRGLLQRYMAIFGDEIDQEIIPEIECYLRIIDAQECEPKFLIHLSDVLGNPPDIFGNDDMYRNLLSYICSIYKIKGTKKAYQLFFSLLGFNIDLIEIPPTTEPYLYDNTEEYDTPSEISMYDRDLCKPCSYYDIIFYPKNQDSIVFDNLLISRLIEAIKFNEPINAKLRNLTLGLSFEDEIGIAIDEESSEIVANVNNYDSENVYDENNYDDIDGIPINYTPLNMEVLIENQTNNIYNFYLKLPLSSLSDIDLANTHISIQAFNNALLIYEEVGFIISPTYNNGFVEGILIKLDHNIPNTYTTLKILGNIRLISDENANFNKLVVIGNNNISLLFT